MLSAPVPITLSSSSSSISSSRNNNNNNNVTDISDPFLDISQNLFAGLKFPEVPKNEIIIKQQQQQQQKEQKQKEDDNYNNNISMIELKSTKSEPKIQNVDITKQKIQPITTNSQAILTPQQFALLYKNDAENTPSVYPSLTELVPDARYFPELESSPPTTTSSSIQNPILEEEEESNEQAPLITPTIKPIEQTNVHDEVMIQLLNENMRLQQQLQQLNNNSNNTTNELQDLEALQRSMNFTLSNTSSQSTINHQPMSQLHQQQQSIQQQQQQLHQQSHLNQQQQQSTLTQEQQHNLKYVCCGNCHQWLSAPRNATYVYCPGCEAVNNCALAPQTPAPATTNRPPARKLEAQPWYLQCFSRVLG